MALTEWGTQTSHRIHEAIQAAINATIRTVESEQDDVTMLEFSSSAIVALIPMLEHAAKLAEMQPRAVIALVALSIAHEVSPDDAQCAVTTLLTEAHGEAMSLMRAARTAKEIRA